MASLYVLPRIMTSTQKLGAVGILVSLDLAQMRVTHPQSSWQTETTKS